jgi:hypothetical protein
MLAHVDLRTLATTTRMIDGLVVTRTTDRSPAARGERPHAAQCRGMPESVRVSVGGGQRPNGASDAGERPERR